MAACQCTGVRDIRILVLSNFYPPHHIGGYELRCRCVVDGLRRRGHHAHVLTGRCQAAAPPDEQGHVTRALHLAWGPPYPPEDLPGLLRCEASDRQALWAALRSTRPDVVDVWGLEFASQSLVVALCTAGLPVHFTLEDVWLADGYRRDPLCAVTAIGRELDVQMSPAVRELCRLGLEHPPLNGARVHFASHALQKRYVNAGFRHSPGHVRLAGIDLSPLRQSRPAPAAPPFVIVSVGQLTASRGQADLITAAAHVATDDRCPFPLVVRIVGGGNAAYVAELKRLADEHASERFRTEFTGPLPPDRVAAFYAGAHLLVHASRLPEGLPRVLMEAMAAGVPVIATNTGGQCDILADGRFGPLLPPGDPPRLASAIRDALAHPPRWQARARAARRHALQHFDIEAYVDGHAQDLADAAARDWNPTAPRIAPTPAEIAAFSEDLGRAARPRAAALDVVADPDGAWRLGVVLKRTGRLAAAAQLFTRLHEAHRDDPTHVRRATFHLAELAVVHGDWPHAHDLLRACLTVAPDHAKAAFDLRYAEQQRLPAHLLALAQRPAPIGV